MPFLKMFQAGNVCKPLPSMDAEQKWRYDSFRKLLGHNRAALSLMADLEQLYYSNKPFTLQYVERKIGRLLAETDGLVSSLSTMSTGDYDYMTGVLNSIRRSLQHELAGEEVFPADPLVLPLDRITRDMAKTTGAKAANLAHIRGQMAMPTPPGFAVTISAYWYFMKESGLIAEIDEYLANMTADDPASLEKTGATIRSRIMATPLPTPILTAIAEAVETLTAETTQELLLAVRSSAVGEDGEVSFAGQYISVLNVPPDGLAEAYKKVVASKYSAAALSYRLHHGLDDLDTPMAVLIIAMIQPRLSGVLFTADPLSGDRHIIRVSAIEGLAESLVSGESSPQHSFRLSKESFSVPPESQPPSIDISVFRELWRCALQLEKDFQLPLDVEWAIDQENLLVLLQVRPLLVPETVEENSSSPVEYPDHPLIIENGKCAASGIATGQVLLWTSADPEKIADLLGLDTILVTRTASTMLTPWVGKVKGIITDIGSTSSHLASVAREFGVPALFDTHIATTVLSTGDTVTLWASNKRVYQGNVRDLTTGLRPIKRPIFASPVHLRMQRLLDRISPLKLVDASSADFQQENCRTIHDIIRFCHEYAVREMFRFGESTDRERNAVQLKVALPIRLYALNLGGGWRQGLTSCDEINAHEVDCLPFRALWRGLSHPGINWTSSVAMESHNFMSLIAGASIPQQGHLGGASYTIISNDYMNLSIQFDYHFATVDVLCTEDPDLNYVALHFGGGAGPYFGKSLRIQFLADVLSRLGFTTAPKGEFLEASLTRLARPAMVQVLNQLGRLLGSTRLLDISMRNVNQIETMTEAFFRGYYDFLEPERHDTLENFYLISGDWQEHRSATEAEIIQDGSHFSSPIVKSINQTISQFVGQRRYIELLDNIEAYHYFPLAVARRSNLVKGSAQVTVKPLSGIIDQAGGLAFAIRDWANYFVFRINALENNAVLFEFHNNKRLQRAKVETQVEIGVWYTLRVEIKEVLLRAYLNDMQVLEYQADKELGGFIGLWTKADSVTLFKDLSW